MIESDPDFTLCGIALIVFALALDWVIQKIKKIIS